VSEVAALAPGAARRERTSAYAVRGDVTVLSVPLPARLTASKPRWNMSLSVARECPLAQTPILRGFG
jgi:hypothetical protein